jgi:hypothetical protein
MDGYASNARSISDREKDNLYLLLDDSDSGYRAKIILLKDEGYTVPEIRKMTQIIMI